MTRTGVNSDGCDSDGCDSDGWAGEVVVALDKAGSGQGSVQVRWPVGSGRRGRNVRAGGGVIWVFFEH